MIIDTLKKEHTFDYEDFIETWIPNYNLVLETAFQLMKNKIGTRGELLVVGAETGNEIQLYKNHDIDWHITGIEPSRDMIEIAAEKLKNYRNVTLIEGEVSQLITTVEFDAVTLILALQLISNKKQKLKLLKDICEQVKPGAPFILVDLFGTKEEINHKLNEFRASSPLILTRDRDIFEERLKLIQNAALYVSGEDLIQLLDETGFENPLKFHQSSLYEGWICFKK